MPDGSPSGRPARHPPIRQRAWGKNLRLGWEWDEDAFPTKVVILWYPGRRGLFFKSGVGVAAGQYSIPTSPTQADTSTGAGIGLTFGAGWDWSISRKFAFTVDLAAYVTAVGDIVVTGRRVDDVIATVYQGSIGFTFR